MLGSRAYAAGITVAAFLLGTLSTAAQVPSAELTPIQRGARVEADVHHDVSPPLWQVPPAPRAERQRVHRVRPLPRTQGGAAAPVDTVLQTAIPLLAIPSTTLNFDGVGNGFSGPQGTFLVATAPPHTNGSVGPNHYVQIVNTDLAVFNKNGTAIYGPVPINTLWSGFGGLCQVDNDGDAIVVYDKIADRWMISQLAVTGADGVGTPFLQCVAVSQTPDPTGSYNRYSFRYPSFDDYPKMGVWPDAYYETFDFFNGNTFAGGEVCAYDRTSMLAGQTATQQCFNVGRSYGGLLPSDLDGARLPPAGSPNYLLALGAVDGQLAFWKFHVDWTTPANTTLTGPTTLTTAPFALPCGGTGGTCIPQPGASQQLDTLGDRLMSRLAYRNFGDHESLVVNHSITAGSSVGVRWYELRSPAATPTIYQQGTYAPDSNYRWMGSIAMDQSGNLALGFSLSGPGLPPQIHYTGRLASDTLGVMGQGEASIMDGAGSQTGINLNHWGDYSAMVIDPTDDCTFWYTNEYIPSSGSFNWKTRVGTFKFPGCGSASDFAISANPGSVSLEQGTSTISTAVVSGDAQAVGLSVSGVPSGATASLNPTSVTAGNSSTLTVNAGTAAPGMYTLTVTGTGASATHSTTVTLPVTSMTGNDFSISANPNSISTASGGSATSTISTVVTSGSTQPVNLSVSGLPELATASFNPPSVNAGGSSTLTVRTSLKTALGTYTLTVTGTGASTSHAATITLTVR